MEHTTRDTTDATPADPAGAMPNFFVVGAQKAGTTSLYHYLEQHPDVFMSPRKEPHYFRGMQFAYRRSDRRLAPVTDAEEYIALFAEVRGEKAVGEASSSYLFSERSPALIKRSVPRAKIIVVLRNPADRAYSNFLHCVRGGSEPLTDFAEALKAEEERREEGWAPLWYYKRKGFYYAQVKRYLDTFGRDQVRIYLYDDLKREPFGMLRDLFGFLGVDETFVPDLSVQHNAAGLPKSRLAFALARRVGAWSPALKVDSLDRVLPNGTSRYIKSRFFAKPPPFPPEVRRRLVADYTDDVQKLGGLIGRDLSAWTRA